MVEFFFFIFTDGLSPNKEANHVPALPQPRRFFSLSNPMDNPAGNAGHQFRDPELPRPMSGQQMILIMVAPRLAMRPQPMSQMQAQATMAVLATMGGGDPQRTAPTFATPLR